MAKTGHPNFDYTCQGAWRGITKNFSIVGNTSGSALSQSDAQTFMEGPKSFYALCFGHFQTPDAIKVMGSKYYDGINSAPVYEAVYNDTNRPAALVPDGLAFATATGTCAPLEVCVMLEAKVGTSKTSKPVYVRKFIRGGIVEQMGYSLTAGAQWDFGANVGIYAQALGNGAAFNSIVYVSPKGVAADSAGWSALVNVGNHQVPRGRKKKVVSGGSSGQSALQLLEKAIEIGGGLALAGE